MHQKKAQNITFAERYDFHYELGSGAVGVVYKARDKLLDKDVAIKLLKYKGVGTGDNKGILRFQHEARACAKLVHNHILTALDFGATEDGEPYLVLDYIDGKTIADILEESGPFTLREAMPFFLEIVSGMAYAHGQGVLHRDLKPSNIMTILINDSPSIKIMDFGLAKLFQDTGELPSELSLTSSGTSIGSPLYMSPEQALGGEVDRRTDIYSFGCIAYEMLTGRAPIVGDTSLQVMQLKQTETPPGINDLNPRSTTPYQFEAIIAKCLATNKNERYSNFEQLRDDFLAFVASGTIGIDDKLQAAKEEVINEKTHQKRKFSRALLLALALVTGLSIASTLVIQKKTDQPKAPQHLVGKEYDLPHPLLEPLSEATVRVGTSNVYFTAMNAKEIKERVTTEMLSKPTLRFLDCDLRDHAVASLAHSRFTGVTIDGCVIDDDVLTDLAKFKSLNHLWIFRLASNIGPSGFAALASAPVLDALDLEQESFVDDDFGILSKYKNLRHLNLKGKGITARGITLLKNAKSLTSIDAGPNLDSKTISMICSMSNLTSVGLSDLKPGQFKQHISEIASMPKFSHLALSRSELANDDLANLSTIPNLEGLTLKAVKITTNRQVMDIVKAKQISNLTLTDMNQLNFEQFIQLGEKPGLKQFYLNGTYPEHERILAKLRERRPALNVSTQKMM